MFKIREQLSRLYLSSALGDLSLTGAWVAILAARGYSLVEIGIVETVFHITSLIFEIPSGVLADVFGRKRMLIVSSIMRMIGNIVMILSDNLFMVSLSLAFYALSYNFSSGTGDALAYDSLKFARMEAEFEKYMSNQLTIHRICGGISTLCAGFALFIGYKMAYGTSLIANTVQIMILLSLREVYAVGSQKDKENKIIRRLYTCFNKSIVFLKEVKKIMGLMLCNSFVGAIDVLLLFFLQAKLLERGIPEWALGMALFLMEMGGVVGSRLILKFSKFSYKGVFVITMSLVLAGVLAEHSPWYGIMVLGGFLAAIGDDALQVRTNAILQDMFPSEQRATLTSVESFTFSIIMIVLSPIAGFVFMYW